MILFFCIFGFLLISTFSNILRFAYEIFNHNKTIAFFASINNSIWEHVKTFILPALLWFIIELPILGDNPNFLLAMILNIFVSLSLVYIFDCISIVLFIKNSTFLIVASNILISLVTQAISFMILSINPILNIPIFISILFIANIGIVLYLFYMKTPQNIIFKDPVSKEYGYEGHICK